VRKSGLTFLAARLAAHRARSGGKFFWGTQPIATGLGFKIGTSDHLFLAPEFRIGWEPNLQSTLSFGYRI
jgi:hypothetical protein